MTAKTDPVVGSETWAVRFDGGTTADVRVDRHDGGVERGVWFYAHCAAWPGVPYAINMSGNTARYAVERLVACGISNADNDEHGCGVREIVPPGEMTRDEAVVAERSRCAALAQSVAEAIDTDAARETASAIVDEMLRDRSRSVETPAQAYGRGRLAGLAEGERIARALAAESEGAHAGGRAMTRDETEPSPAALEACGVGPRRGDARSGRSVARRGLPVAAATWCPTCGGSGRRLLAGWREVRCDECRTTGRVAAEGGE